MAYTTLTKVNSLFGISMTQAVFDDLLAAVKLYIDRYTGKTFESVSETRYYDSNGGDVLNIDSFHGSAIVTLLDSEGNDEVVLTEGADDDYITAPYNSSEKNQIFLLGNGSRSSFGRGVRRVKVTATFGFSSSVPADIQLVASRLIGEMWNASIVSATGDIKSESLGDYSINYSNVGEVREGDLESISDKLGIYSILDLYRDLDV